MNHGKQSKAILAAIDSQSKSAILANVAKQYGISQADAYEEVTDDEAESLLDYVTGTTRPAVAALMIRHGAAA